MVSQTSLENISISQLSQEDTPKASKCQKITKKALQVLMGLGEFLLNVVTLGTYGAIRQRMMEKKFEKLEEEELDLQDELEALREQNRESDHETSRIDLDATELRDELEKAGEERDAAQDQLRKLREDNGEVLAEYDHAIDGRRSAKRKRDDLRNEIRNVRMIRETAIEQKGEAEGNLAGIQQRRDDAVQEKDLLQADLLERQEAANPDREREENLRVDAVRQADEAEEEVDVLEVERGEVRRQMEQLGPRAPKYTPLGTDPTDIDGAWETDGIFADRYNDARTMRELMERALDHTIGDLLEEADEYTYEELTGDMPPDNAKQYHISAAENYAYINEPRWALFELTALTLIDGGKMETDCHRNSSLILNENDLKVGWSKPIVARTGEGENTTTLYQHVDEWTPMPESEARDGVDPISVKRILNRLRPEEKEHLRNLILEQFMLPDNENLRAARIFMKRNAERSQLVQTAKDLIADMGYVLDLKFRSARVLRDRFWDDELEMFQVPDDVVIDDDIPTDDEEWTPNYDCMSANLQAAVRRSVETYSTLWDHISDGILEPTSALAVRNGSTLPSEYEVTKQFKKTHYYMDQNVNCLFTGLASLVHLKDPSREEVEDLRRAMANYLDTTNEFDQLILRYTGRTAREYKEWLRNPGFAFHYDGGDLELQIAAGLLGVKVGTLVINEQVHIDEDSGLLMPGARVYGPNTTPMLHMYNNGGGTYSAILPRVRQRRTGDSPELQEALTRARGYGNGVYY